MSSCCQPKGLWGTLFMLFGRHFPLKLIVCFKEQLFSVLGPFRSSNPNAHLISPPFMC